MRDDTRDWLHEMKIDRLRGELLRAKGDAVVMAFKQLAEAIKARSPEQVARMERERGLA